MIHARVTGQNVCQDANQPNTRSLRAHRAREREQVHDRAALLPVAHLPALAASSARSIATKLDSRL